MTTHPACPLTDATQPLYEQLAALRWQDEPDADKRRLMRLERARLTGELWRLARDINKNKEQK